jgi:hypothetical protein
MDDSTRIILFIALFSLGVSSSIIGGLVQIAIIGEVNRKLPERSQIGYFGGHLGKAFLVSDEYKRLYPRGRLLLIFNFLLAAGMGLIASSAVVLFRLAG